MYAADSTGFTNIEIRPDGAPSPAGLTFTGSTDKTRVHFHSDPTAHDLTAFPEPPVIIDDVAHGASCRIEDGGIWTRDGVYADDAHRVVALAEYSGSNSELVFYSSRSCKPLAVVDVSEKLWQLEGDRLTLGSHCKASTLESCRTVRHRRLFEGYVLR